MSLNINNCSLVIRVFVMMDERNCAVSFQNVILPMGDIPSRLSITLMTLYQYYMELEKTKHLEDKEKK